MKIIQVKNGALPGIGYYIESHDEAIIIDPPGNMAPEIRDAAKRSVTIKYVLSTEFDTFVASNQIEIANKKARIVFGSLMYDSHHEHYAFDGEELAFGDHILRVIHTPGHSSASTSYLLMDRSGNQIALFTGKTLLAGQPGFPDCVQNQSIPSWKIAADQLYDSIIKKIATLNENVAIYPGIERPVAWAKSDGAKITYSVGNLKNTKLLSGEISKRSFTAAIISEYKLTHFSKEQVFTINGGNIQVKPFFLSIGHFVSALRLTNALVIDLRDYHQFIQAFIPGAIYIDRNRNQWVNKFVPNREQFLLLVTDKGYENETIDLFHSLGYRNVLGVLAESMQEWVQHGLPYDNIDSICSGEFSTIVKRQGVNVLDVRSMEEYHPEHFAGALHIPLEYAGWKIPELDKHKHYYIYGTKDYRAIIFISLLKARGFLRLTEISGGLMRMRNDQTLRKNKLIIREEIL